MTPTDSKDTRHSPMLWEVKYDGEGFYCISDANGNKGTKEELTRIVHAVNSHASLVEEVAELNDKRDLANASLAQMAEENDGLKTNLKINVQALNLHRSLSAFDEGLAAERDWLREALQELFTSINGVVLIKKYRCGKSRFQKALREAQAALAPPEPEPRPEKEDLMDKDR